MTAPTDPQPKPLAEAREDRERIGATLREEAQMRASYMLPDDCPSETILQVARDDTGWIAADLIEADGKRLAEADELMGETPAARWREHGYSDPHGTNYDCERARLVGGHLTDDEVAFKVAMVSRDDVDHEAVVQMAKDRIRWLSRALVKALSQPPVPAADAEGWVTAEWTGYINGLIWAGNRVGKIVGNDAHTVIALRALLDAEQKRAEAKLAAVRPKP